MQLSHMKQSWIRNTRQRTESTNHAYSHWAAPWRYEHIRLEQLIHWGPDKMAAVYRMAFLHAIVLNGNIWIAIKVSLNLFAKGPVNRTNNNPAVIQMITCRLNDAKKLWLAINGSLRTHICVTGPHWVKFAVIDICRCKIGRFWVKQLLIGFSRPCYYLNWCWFRVT